MATDGMGGYSLGDIVAALRGGDGLAGGDGLVLLVVLLLLFGNGGMGGNGNAVQADVNRGFDNQNLQAQTRDILAAVTGGTAQGIAATNQTFHDNLMATQNLYNELQRDIAALGVGQANALANQNQCCCSTRLQITEGNAALSAQIAQNEYNNAMRDAATNANFTAQIHELQKEGYEREMASLRSEIASLRGAIDYQGINARLDAIQSNMVTYPRGWTYNAGSSPFCNCGCPSM